MVTFKNPSISGELIVLRTAEDPLVGCAVPGPPALVNAGGVPELYFTRYRYPVASETATPGGAALWLALDLDAPAATRARDEQALSFAAGAPALSPTPMPVAGSVSLAIADATASVPIAPGGRPIVAAAVTLDVDGAMLVTSGAPLSVAVQGELEVQWSGIPFDVSCDLAAVVKSLGGAGAQLQTDALALLLELAPLRVAGVTPEADGSDRALAIALLAGQLFTPSLRAGTAWSFVPGLPIPPSASAASLIVRDASGAWSAHVAPGARVKVPWFAAAAFSLDAAALARGHAVELPAPAVRSFTLLFAGNAAPPLDALVAELQLPDGTQQRLPLPAAGLKIRCASGAAASSIRWRLRGMKSGAPVAGAWITSATEVNVVTPDYFSAMQPA